VDPRLIPLLHSQYGIDSVQVVEPLKTNGQREAYLLQTELGRLVIKITDPDRSEEVVQTDVGILDDLARFEFPAPIAVHTLTHGLYLPFENRFFYLYHWIEGKKPSPSASMLAQCGALLAALHNLPLDRTARRSFHRPSNLLPEINSWLLDAPDTSLQREMAGELLAIAAAFPSFEDLPETLIHTDPYFVNLLDGADGRMYLIDWEDAGCSYPLLDVGYLGHLTTYLPHDRINLGLTGSEAITWRPDWAQAFLDGYQAKRRLTDLERSLFPWAVRLNFLMYIWDWDQKCIIPENYQRLKLLETLQPVWR
jgi:Ser/Thr protein kinase RdoA (MazF antagonist)